MAASPPVSALPWYDRHDYQALLELFSDPDKLPTTYDAWLERAEGVERQFKKAGYTVTRFGSAPFSLPLGVRIGTFLPIRRRALPSLTKPRNIRLPGTNVQRVKSPWC